MMRKLVVVGSALGIAAFFVAIIAIGGALRPEVETRVAPQVAPIVFVKEVEYGPINLSVRTQGEVQPRRQIQLASQIGGRIESVSPSFANGGVFRRGETLVKIEDADYRLAVTRARAQVAQAEQRLAVEEAEAALAARDYQELSGQDADTDPSLLALRKPQLAAAQADLASAKANLSDAELALKRTAITAPFNGRVRETSADIGQFVSAGTPLGEIFATDVAEVRLPLTDQDLAKLGLAFAFEAEGDEAPLVKLTADVAGQVRNWEGRIRRVDAAIDSSTRQIAAIAEVEDPYGTGADEGFPLAFGLFVNAEILGQDLPRAVVVPLLALQGDGTVFVVNDEDKLLKRDVTTAGRVPEGMVVTAGVESGDLLVVSPVTTGPGNPVRPLYPDGTDASRAPQETDSAGEGDPVRTGAANAAAVVGQQGSNL